jgi:Sigma-70, region 4
MGPRSIDEAADAELFCPLAPGLRRFAAVVRPPGMGAWEREARVSGPDEHRDRYPSDVTELMRVPERARAVLYLTIVDGLSYRDASRIVACSEEAARAMASRALKQLRIEVESELRDERRCVDRGPRLYPYRRIAVHCSRGCSAQ